QFARGHCGARPEDCGSGRRASGFFHFRIVAGSGCGDGPAERSGKRKWVHFRWACPKFLRQSFHEWAGHSIAQSAWARAFYQQQRRRGSDHHAAVRALAFKWVRIVFRCWKDRVAYDENKYLAALAKRGSPLSKLVVVGVGSSL